MSDNRTPSPTSSSSSTSSLLTPTTPNSKTETQATESPAASSYNRTPLAQNRPEWNQVPFSPESRRILNLTSDSDSDNRPIASDSAADNSSPLFEVPDSPSDYTEQETFIEQEQRYISQVERVEENISSCIQNHCQCLFLGYSLDSEYRLGIPYTGYSTKCSKNIPRNKSIKHSYQVERSKGEKLRSWSPSLTFFNNILKHYHDNEGNKYGANLHSSLLEGETFSKLYEASHLICPNCYVKIMQEILGTVELQEYEEIKGDPLSNLRFDNQSFLLNSVPKESLFWKIFTKYKKETARNIMIEWDRLNAINSEDDTTIKRKTNIKSLIINTLKNKRYSNLYLKYFKQKRNDILLSLKNKKVSRENLFFHSLDPNMTYLLNGFQPPPYSKITRFYRLKSYYLRDYLNKYKVIYEDSESTEDDKLKSKSDYEKQKTEFQKINRSQEVQLENYQSNFPRSSFSYVYDLEDDYLYLKYLKLDLIDKRVITSGELGQENQYWNEFIRDFIEQMTPKPSDELKIFTKENFREVIKLLNGTKKAENLAKRAVAGKRTRSTTDTPQISAAAAASNNPPSFVLPPSPDNSPRRPKVSRTAALTDDSDGSNASFTASNLSPSSSSSSRRSAFSPSI